MVSVRKLEDGSVEVGERFSFLNAWFVVLAPLMAGPVYFFAGWPWGLLCAAALYLVGLGYGYPITVSPTGVVLARTIYGVPVVRHHFTLGVQVELHEAFGADADGVVLYERRGTEEHRVASSKTAEQVLATLQDTLRAVASR